MADTHQWQVAIIDRRLPDMDGVMLCHEFHLRTKHLILLTGEDESRDTIEGLELGADDYVTKPFQPMELLARVRAATRSVERPIWAEVFISYAREDTSAAMVIYDGLLQAGFRPWLDKHSLQAGEEWRSAIAGRIQTTDAVVVCLSKSANEKGGYLQEEHRLILKKGEQFPPGKQFVVPVRLDGCNIPQAFEKYHCVDYADPNLLQRIIASLRRG